MYNVYSRSRGSDSTVYVDWKNMYQNGQLQEKNARNMMVMRA